MKSSVVGCLVLLAVGCDDKGGGGATTDDVGTEDTDTLPSVDTDVEPPTGDSGGTSTGAPQIDSYTGTCLNDDTYFGELVATAAASVAVLNIWETSAPDEMAWNEEHDLAVSGSGSFGAQLDVTLTQVSSVGDQQNGSTTLFGCGSGEQLAETDGLTYAIRVYDLDGNLAACGAFGGDPGTVGSGTYTTIGGAPSSAADLAGCTVM